jgi:hypothetical protein
MAKMGCAKCGGTMKKMAKGGPINKPMTYAKPQKGGDNQKNFIYGMPTAGIGETDGKNGKMKKGGNVKAVKHSCPPGMVRSASGGCIAERKPGMKKGGTMKKMAKGGSTSFGMLSVKAGVDKNPRPTAADRIAGAKKKK